MIYCCKIKKIFADKQPLFFHASASAISCQCTSGFMVVHFSFDIIRVSPEVNPFTREEAVGHLLSKR